MVLPLAAGLLALSLAAPAQPKPKGFLAAPPSGKGPGVLVLHPWWGLNGDVKSFCKRLADEGFVAFAPDLFHGKVASTIPAAEALVKAAKDDLVAKDVEASVQYLAKRTAKSAKGIAVVGFSFGAGYALQVSNTEPGQVRAVVVFYGTGMNEFGKSRAAYLGHFAEKDDFEPAESVERFRKALQQANRPATIYTYPDTGHWFFEPSRKDAYKPAAANLAWQRTVDFLKISNAAENN